MSSRAGTAARPIIDGVDGEKKRLIEEHLHLIPPMVWSAMRGRPASYLGDVESDARYGLVNAAVKYDPSKGDFDRWARFIIKNAIRDGFRARTGFREGRDRPHKVEEVALLPPRNPSGQEVAGESHWLAADDPRLDDVDFRLWLADVTGKLPERLACVVPCILGWVLDADLAESLGVSESRVSQLRAEALWRLRLLVAS